MDRRSELLALGVDPRYVNRPRAYPIPKFEQKFCRDREPWGGSTNPEACTCVGKCGVDAMREAKDA